MKSISKTYEITCLRELFYGRGYFADALNNDQKELDIIEENIKNDFPIFTGTMIEKPQVELSKKIDKFIDDMLKSKIYSTFDNRTEIDNLLYDLVGIQEVIRRKHALRMSLTCTQVDYLVSNMK